MFLGRWEIDDVITFTANTHTASTGAATDADVVPPYRVYEDETGVAILTGNMAKLDDANTTGFYSEAITLSAANGFEVGKSYTIYVAATVGGVLGTMSHSFQVEAALATQASVDAKASQASVDTIDTEVGTLQTTLDTKASQASVDTVQTTISKLDNTLEDDLGVFRFTTNALEQAPTSGLDAAGVRAAIGMGSANLDAQLTAIDDFIDTEISAIKLKTDNLPDDPADQSLLTTLILDLPTAAENATELLDQANGVETGFTVRQIMRLVSAVLLGKSSGHPTAPIYRDVNDLADRVTATVSAGNRTVVTKNTV